MGHSPDDEHTAASRRRGVDEHVTFDDPPTTEVGFALAEKIVGNRFRLGERLSWGGMGTIYRALDLVTDLEVAVKIPHLGDPQNDTRFKSESKAIASVACSSVIGYVASGSVEEPFLAMELVQGEPLWKHLRRGALAPEAAIAVARRIASALASIHLVGWIHRDIKPGNIVIAKDGAAKLLDFGLSRPIDGEGAGTMEGQLIGTLGYMAPEQFSGKRAVDPAVDIYALGVVLFECFSGRRAFRRTVVDIVSRTPDPPLDVAGLKLEPKVAALISASVEPDASKRPRDGLDFLVRLVAAIDPTFAAPPLDHARGALLHLLRDSAVHVRGSGASSAIGEASRLARVLAEMLAPSLVLRVACDPRESHVAGAHAGALAQLLDAWGQVALAARLREEPTPQKGATRAVVVILEEPVWCDEPSAKLLFELATAHVIHLVLASSSRASLSGPLAAVPQPGMGPDRDAGNESELRDVVARLNPMARWCLRAASMFGRRFSLAGVRHLVGGVEARDVGREIDAMRALGLFDRIETDPPVFAFSGATTLALALELVRPNDARLGSRLAARFLGEPVVLDVDHVATIEAACPRLAGA